jgi:hypothetical protein
VMNHVLLAMFLSLARAMGDAAVSLGATYGATGTKTDLPEENVCRALPR